jgi:hypothetical protein
VPVYMSSYWHHCKPYSVPAECYISPRLFYARIIQKYSLEVILPPKPATHFADLQHVCEFVRENIHIRVRCQDDKQCCVPATFWWRLPIHIPLHNAINTLASTALLHWCLGWYWITSTRIRSRQFSHHI